MSETEPKTRIPYKAFVAAAARAFCVPLDKLTSGDRHTDVVRARFAAALLIRMHRPEASLPEIGRRLGGRDHTTVLHGISRANRFLKTDRAFTERYLAAERDALAWTPGRPQADIPCLMVVVAPREPKRPPAVKILALSDTVEYVPTGGKTKSGAPVRDDFDQKRWFVENDRRFRAAMLRAHPERAPAAMREAAE